MTRSDVDIYLTPSSGSTLVRCGSGRALGAPGPDPDPEPEPTPGPEPVTGTTPGIHPPSWERPFATTSIWKREYDKSLPQTPAGTSGLTDTAAQLEMIHMIDGSGGGAVTVNHYDRGDWGNRCATKGALLRTVKAASGWHLLNHLDRENKNNQCDFLEADGVTIYPTQASTACNSTTLTAGDLYSRRHSINGDGLTGGHGAARIGHGGVLRGTDLTDTDILHVLDILANPDYLSRSNGGYRWPALAADANYANSSSAGYYAGSVPSMRMGSLVTIPQDYDLSALDAFHQKLGRCLKTFGAYILDITAWDAWALAVDSNYSSNYTALFNKTQFLTLVKQFRVVEQTA